MKQYIISIAIWMMSLCVVADQAKPLVVTTIKPLALIAGSALGDRAKVEYLFTPQGSAHHLSWRISQLRRIEAADLVIWGGEALEGALGKAFADIPRDKLIEIQAIEGLHWPSGSGAHQHDHHSSSRDPHVWLNPHNANVVARVIQSRLGLAPSTLFADEEIAQFAVTLKPAQGSSYIFQHDAFRHFTETFALSKGQSLADAAGNAKGIRGRLALQQGAQPPACVFAEKGSYSKAAAVTAERLQVPLIELDLMGVDSMVNDRGYQNYLDSLRTQFLSCFKSG